MNKPLDQLSTAELIALLGERDQRIEKLEGILAKFQKMLFGQKRERFESPDQLSLPFETTAEVQQVLQEELTQKVEYVRRKSGAGHPGRTKLPEQLPVEEIELYPEGNLEEMTCIGKEITEELDYVPAKFIIRRYIRYKYVSKAQDDKSPIVIAALPSRLIDKSIVGTGLLASILTDKYVDHLPLYRQLQRFKRENIPIASSTLDGWVRQGLERLEILYGWLVKDTCGKGYLQADETTIKVLDSTKKKDTHLGYYWVYHNPVDGTVLFDYQKGRNQEAPQKILEGFKGYLQTDGYIGYDPYAALPGVTHLCCWAHARRKFFEAQENDRARAELALVFIGKLYEIEAHCREKKLTPKDRKAYRLDKALPVIDAFSKWLTENYAQTLPKSAIGMAMAYTMRLWKELSNYLLDGVLEIDNNTVENRIRPVALGRKNYLFAGSHQAAQRAAMIYSF
ncbi:IS66 family transposase, partial [Algoriphagus confluentis]|uniref:IS66 family transposase n=1 Tax=Algoriphagus confluentis TaxID=1697556 RepID=UPI0030C71412